MGPRNTEAKQKKGWENRSNDETITNFHNVSTFKQYFSTSVLTNAQQDVPQMPQVEIGKQVNEIEGHEREAEDNTYPFLTSFALKEKKKHEHTH